MYSEYTTGFTHSIQFLCILYNLYCIVHIDYTDSQLYFDIILYTQKGCKNKCAVCAIYSVHCTYCIYMRIAQYAFLLACKNYPLVIVLFTFNNSKSI